MTKNQKEYTMRKCKCLNTPKRKKNRIGKGVDLVHNLLRDINITLRKKKGEPSGTRQNINFQKKVRRKRRREEEEEERECNTSIPDSLVESKHRNATFISKATSKKFSSNTLPNQINKQIYN